MIHFELLYHPVRRSQFNPQTIFVSLGSWKKNWGHSSKKDNHPGPFPQQGFCTSLQIWDELGVTWQTKQIVCFFAISGANFKHSLFMILSGFCLLTMWDLPRRVFYFVSLKTILAALFRTFGLPIRVLPSKPSFLHDHCTTNIRIFPDF